jgi:ribulose 1,5-bisphosphate synthetase/thiazole synthase
VGRSPNRRAWPEARARSEERDFTQPAVDYPVTMGEVMSTTEQYDVVVIGSGEAGKYLAWTLSKEGHRTTLVERKMVGGSCPNVACLPSKNIIHSAKAAS